MAQHVSSNEVCMDPVVVLNAWNCTVGYYVKNPSTITGSKLVCPSCTQNTFGNPSVMGMPNNAHYTGPSPVISFDKCPWQCNTGLSQTLGFCYPGADCSVYSEPLQLYSTVRYCDIVSPSSCPSGYINIPASASVLTAHSTRFTALLMHNLANSTVSGAAGRQCIYTDADTGNLDGNFSTATFGTPLLAQQSGGSDLTVVFDNKYLVLKTINRTSQQVKTIAGGGGTTSIDGIGTNASFSNPTLHYFTPTTPPTEISTQIAVNHNATAALVWDNGLIRYVNLSTGKVTTICGQSNTFGYAEGTGANVLYQAVSSISLSPDASFALIVDYSHTLRYLNISTKTSSLLAGYPNVFSSIDGIGILAYFCFSRSVAVSNNGKFALVGDCGDPTFYVNGISNGYPTIRYVDIVTGTVTTIGGDWEFPGHVDSIVLIDGVINSESSELWCPIAITIASDDSYALFLDNVNFALRTIDLTTYQITTLDKLATSYDTLTNTSFPTSISNVIGSGNAKMSPTCQPCPAGTYQNNSACTPCAPGTYSHSGASQCTQCPPGSAGSSPTGGSNACVQCSAGTYNAGLAACTPCAPGTYSSSGASQCTPCAPGYTASSPTGGSNACVQCSAGTYNAGSGGACTPCTPGTYSSPGAAQCTPCAAGTYDTSLTGGSNTCTSCSAGTYNTGLGNMVGTPSANVQSIAATVTGLPVPLNAGDYCSYPVADAYPVEIAANNAASASMACNNAQCPWPVGQYCQFSSYVPPNKYYWHCIGGCSQTNRCLNIYNASYTGPGTTSPDSCPYQCNPGFNNATLVPSLGFVCSAQPPCAQCPAGTYSDSPGATVCKNCPTSSSCSNGYYLSGCGGSSAGSCVRCTN